MRAMLMNISNGAIKQWRDVEKEIIKKKEGTKLLRKVLLTSLRGEVWSKR